MQSNQQFDYYVKTKEIQGVPIATGLDWFKVIGNFISFATVVIQGFQENSKKSKKLAQIQAAVDAYQRQVYASSLIDEINNILKEGK